MRRLVHKTIGAVAAMTLAIGVATSPVVAQTTTVDFKQVQLTEKTVQGFIAAQKDLAAMASKLQAELEGVATKNGFTNFADLDDTAANISMVMAGLDPQSGEYVDPVEAIKKEMEEIKKDDKIPEKDKKQMLDEMDQALKTTPPLQYKENVALVKKFQKEIEKALQ